MNATSLGDKLSKNSVDTILQALDSFDTPIQSLASCRGKQNADAR
jgi:hypothetical protein